MPGPGYSVPQLPGFPPGMRLLYPFGYRFVPGQLPGDTGGGAPAPGGTQVGYPDNTAQTPPSEPAFPAGSPIVISYIESGASSTSTAEAHAPPPIRIYLGNGAAGTCVPGSLRFTFRGRTYVDRSGALYYAVDPDNNTGTIGGTIDYSTNTATVTEYGSGNNTVTIVSMLTRYIEPGVSGVMFRTTGSPIKLGSLTLVATTTQGVELVASVDINGTITGAGIKGGIAWNTGLVRVAFGDMVTAGGNEAEPWYDADLIDGSGKIWRPTLVDPGTIRFGTVILTSIPIDPTLIGVDPVRLPYDGRVLGFNPGSIGVVSHTQTTVLTPTPSDVTDLGRTRISYIELLDALGEPIESVWYTLDMGAGTVTWASPLNLSAYTMPVTIRDRIQDVRLITDVQITGEITLAAAVTHTYPAGAIVSNAILFTDRQSRVANVFDQQTYAAGVWLDELSGAPAGATYNTVTYPLDVQNSAAIDERWAIQFVNSTIVNVIGETTGQILTGVAISDDIAPVNPVTITGAVPLGKPYFSIAKEGWGGGWQAGNVLRFNTVSATAPIWAARTVTPGDIEYAQDQVRAQVYGNAY